MTYDGEDPDLEPVRDRWAPWLLAAIALLVVLDLIADGLDLGDPLHLPLEIAAVLLGAGGALWLRTRAERARRRHVAALAERLAIARENAGRAAEEAARWRAEADEALRGLGAAIDRQCDRWELSAAEREVAMLLLKGLAMKEIAEARGTSERTARQQALAVYRKSGLGGRAELAAFFLEDLLLPSR